MTQLPLDSSAEEWRAACEARVVRNMRSHKERRAYLDKVTYHRGSAAAEALRKAAWALFDEGEDMPEAPRG